MNTKKTLQDKKIFILDLDGTLYQGANVFPFTGKFLEKLRQQKKQPIFLTNNSSKSTDDYWQKLKKLGIAKSREEIYTSARATLEYLLSKKITRIYLLATPSVEKEFEEAGFTLMKNITEENLHGSSYRQTSMSGTFTVARATSKSVRAHSQLVRGKKLARGPLNSLPQAVVLTFDTTFNYQKFCLIHDLLTRDVPFYATHPDEHLPIENGEMHPDIGALLAAIKVSTGRKPFIVGKPTRYIYQQLQSRLKCKKEEMVMIGDRLSTDIKGANNFGITSVLVLSGETTKSMAKKSRIKAAYTLKNIEGILKNASKKSPNE